MNCRPKQNDIGFDGPSSPLRNGGSQYIAGVDDDFAGRDLAGQFRLPDLSAHTPSGFVGPLAYLLNCKQDEVTEQRRDQPGHQEHHMIPGDPDPETVVPEHLD